MYQTLYRKYRPKNFDDVVGQDVVVRTLKNSIINDRLSHAYLFFGSRGVGKTSIAKIFARTVNCEKHDGNICDKCDCCKSSIERECLDIIEIDAASNNGVDEIRELIDKVNLVPNELKYKVYIIDEVHMLTIQAFNALLKTLEEPPKHTIFILATTELHKVPETIVSRCQCFSFNRISNSDIIQNLKRICENEKIEIEEKVLEKIANTSNGGMRDSIGMLDKLYAYSGNKIVMEDYLKLNRMVSDDDISDFIDYVMSYDSIKMMELIDNWNDSGINIIQLSETVIYFLKNQIVEKIKNGNNADIDKYISLINLINEKMFDIKKSSNAKIYFEILFLDFINKYSNNNSTKELDENVHIHLDKKKEEEKIIDTVVKAEIKEEKIVDSSNDINNSNIMDIINVRVNNIFAKADKGELKKDLEIFKKLQDYVFDQQNGYYACALLDGKIRASSDDGIIISYEYDSIVNDYLSKLDGFSEVLKTILNIDKKIAILTNEKWEEEKKKYITKLKNDQKYEFIEEPKLVFQEKKVSKSSDNDSIINTFGDIVEVE